MDTEEAFLQLAADVDETDALTKRPHCPSCSRPAQTCWCSALPHPRITCQTRVYVLQHPAEQNRRLQTAYMLKNGLQEGLCRIFRSRKYHAKRNLEQAGILSAPNSLLLYPGSKAVCIDEIPRLESGGYNLVLLDGTWNEARQMYSNNEILRKMKMVKLPENGPVSQYVVRTQPKDGCLSTVESAAMAIAILENRPDVYEKLTAPLRQACEYQLEFGAVCHESKETRDRKKAIEAGDHGQGDVS